jgi:hypothetical protein
MLTIKIEIGDRKFEAQGPADVVQANAAAFLKLFATVTAGPPEPARIEEPALPLQNIMRSDDTRVWLTVRVRSAAEAVLLLLLGHRELLGIHLVSGTAIMEGLRASGQRKSRADHFLNSHARNRRVTSIGKHRARRYQLTDSGAAKALELAKELLLTVPNPKQHRAPSRTRGKNRSAVMISARRH